MGNRDSWAVATSRKGEGDGVIRFNYGRRAIADDPTYSRMIEVHLVGSDTTDLDEYLAGLDSLEDTVRGKVEQLDSCVMLMSFTGAGFRNLLFAFGGSETQAQVLVEEILQHIPPNSAVRSTSPNWNLFRALADRVAT